MRKIDSARASTRQFFVRRDRRQRPSVSHLSLTPQILNEVRGDGYGTTCNNHSFSPSSLVQLCATSPTQARPAYTRTTEVWALPGKVTPQVLNGLHPNATRHDNSGGSDVCQLPSNAAGLAGDNQISMQLTASTLALIAKLISGVTVRWIDSQPDTCQRIYFANHTSHLDALIIWASLPAESRQLTRPVAARDYWDKGSIRRHIAKSFNVLLIDRENIKVHNSPIHFLLREMGDTHSVIVFPEGGRNTSGKLNDFKSGIYHLSKKRPDIELVPAYMDNMNRILPRGEFLPVPLLSSITFGPPMWLDPGEPKKEFLLRAKNAVERLRDDD